MAGQSLLTKPRRVHVETFPAGPLGCNCSIVADVDSRRAVIVDPGGDYARIRARLDALDLHVDAIGDERARNPFLQGR